MLKIAPQINKLRGTVTDIFVENSKEYAVIDWETPNRHRKKRTIAFLEYLKLFSVPAK